MASKPKDLTGNRYGRLVAQERMELSPNAGYFWKCLCDCGTTTKVTIGNLNSGHTLSCGCFKADTTSKVKTTHGMCKTKEYKSWVKMRERCLSENDSEYKNYGALGIEIQDTWTYDFNAFIQYIGLQPKDGLKYSIDRIDNDRGYEEGNVRWATYHMQARNKTKFISNTSGFSGVLWDSKVWPDKCSSTLYAKAIWTTLEGKQKTKCFSTKRFGLLPAFALACDYREKKIAELNSLGAGYTDKHGK